MQIILKVILTVLPALIVSGCSRPDEPAQNPPTLPGQEEVLATVNGSAITRYDVDQSIRASFGDRSPGLLDADGRQKVLESLVAARAIAQSQAAALDEKQNAVLNWQVAAYREQMLVKMYLAANTAAEPVSQQMVEDYYRSHLEQFGAKTVRRYEMISATGAVADAQRDKLLPALNGAGQVNDWRALVQKLKTRGLAVQFTSGRVDPGVLQPKLRDLMAPLTPGQVSDLTFIDTGVYIVRIIDEHKIPARPLEQVSARIRKILLPVQLKKAVKQAAAQVLANAEVQYSNESMRNPKHETGNKIVMEY